MRPSQRPTAQGVRVRSTRDANVLFHAVTVGILPMVNRRLDAADRAALRAGNVYVWEERSPAADATGAGMERFTEGRHWYPSRVRDDFLLYVEKDMEANEAAERNRILRDRQRGDPYSSSSSYGSLTVPPVVRRQPLVKQTYSAWVNIDNSVRKWHMNAYYTEDALEQLLTVDDIPVLANLHVPHECYQRARSSTASSSKKAQQQQQLQQYSQPGGSPQDAAFPTRSAGSMPRRNSTASASGSQSSASDREHAIASPVVAHPRYAPFPPAPVSPQAAPPPVRANMTAGDGIRASLPPLSMPSQTQSPYGERTSRPMHSPSPALSTTPTVLSAHDPYSPAKSRSPEYGNRNGRATATLVPLDRLRTGQGAHSLRREPADDEILRSFRPL